MADDLIMEKREAAMVSQAGEDVVVRKAHFLEPSMSPAAKYKDLPLKINYQGWKRPLENWKSWVDQLHSSHHSTWERAGILGPILASKCNIHRHEDLIMDLVEKWCPKTNTFLFPWGEATITLEDMMMIGGYSVLGESVFKASEDEEMDETIEKLVSARSDLSRSYWGTADRSKWMAKFMGTGSEIEHEAFLTYWLSRFIFPFTRNTITTNVIPIAAHLARGTKVALGPSILASIYKSLTLMKDSLITARECREENDVRHVTISAPLSLVQVWIWERFPSLRPRPESKGKGPRLARWDDLKLGLEYSTCLTIDSGWNNFRWQPYKIDWEMVDSDLVGFARCVRTSELVSLEETCIEQYLPHRVALQFGMDQDIPGDIARVNANHEIAWKHYIRPIRDAKLYVPPYDYKPCVTTRYLTWWKKVGKAGAFLDQKVVEKRKRPVSSSSKLIKVGKDQKVVNKRKRPVSSSAKFGARSDYSKSVGRKGSSTSLKRRRKYALLFSSSDESDHHPPGFAPKEKARHSSMSNRVDQEATQSEDNENVQSHDDTRGRINHSSLPTTNGNDQESEQIEAPTDGEESRRVEEARMDKTSCASPSQVSRSQLDKEFDSLQQRIVVMEKLVAFIKAGKIVCTP